MKAHPDAPFVSHEIGQWCAYPNYEEIPKYTGFFKAKNFEVFQEMAKRNGLLPQAKDFLMASGKLQTLCYKHDIEAAMRTPASADSNCWISTIFRAKGPRSSACSTRSGIPKAMSRRRNTPASPVRSCRSPS